MDAKAFAFILVIAFIGGLGGIIYETTAIDDINRELQSVNQNVHNIESHLKTQREYLELRKEAFALVSALDIVRKEADALHKEIGELRQRKDRTQESLEETVAKTRVDSAGLQLGDIVLANGVTLKNARINRVEGTITSILHSEGIAKLEPAVLPQELKDRLRFEITTKSDQEVVVAKKADVEVPANNNSPSKTRINDARFHLDKLQMELAQIEREYSQVQSSGTSDSSPARRYYAQKREAVHNQQINALRRRIDEATLNLKKAENDANPR